MDEVESLTQQADEEEARAEAAEAIAAQLRAELERAQLEASQNGSGRAGQVNMDLVGSGSVLVGLLYASQAGDINDCHVCGRHDSFRFLLCRTSYARAAHILLLVLSLSYSQLSGACRRTQLR